MRWRWVGLGAVLAAAALLALPQARTLWRERAVRRAPQHPDVILITMDTTRADRLGCYGSDGGASPALDGLARSGVLFRRAYSHVPTTLAAHATILTGLTPARHGIHENGMFVLDAGLPTLAEAFRRAGYRTGAFVSTIVLDKRYGLGRGFDEYVDEVETDDTESVLAEVPAEVTVGKALSFLEAADPRPLFLWVHLYDPHNPYAPPEPFASRFKGRPYDGEIAYMDSQIGRLLEAAQARARPTLVAAAADHGESLGEHLEPTHAFFVYGATQHVPLLISFPGVLPAGRAVEPLVRGVDIAPTLLDLTGLAALDSIDGRSLVPLVTGRSTQEPGPAYQESYGPRLWWGAQEILGVRSGPWLYVRAPRPELYNVEEDPAETVNVAAEQPQELDRLESVLGRLIPEGDPLARRASVDPETARKLRALGYLGGSGASASGSRPKDLADPKDVAPLLQEIANAESFLNRRDYPKALEAFEGLVPKMSDSTMIRARVAKILLALDRYDDAFEAYSALREAQPDDEGYHIGRARVRFRQGRLLEALALVRQSLGVFPDSPTLHENAGTILEVLKRADEAAVEFRKAIDLAPDELGPRLAMAANLDKRGRASEAAGAFVEVATMSPHSRQGRQAGRRLGAMGEAFARQNQLEAARAAYAGSLRTSQAGPAIFLNAALVSYRLGHRDEARSILEAGTRRFPGTADLLYRLGRLQAESRATVEAEATYKRALEIDGGRRDVTLALAQLYESAGRTGEAAALYGSLASVAPPTKESEAAARALSRLRGNGGR
jgi:arylsulfatase A-like enzyme/tetratricopeptide (TPR) repeat protein